MTLSQQLGNVGSEVSRMIKWRGKDDAIAERAFERMLELIDLTLQSQVGGSRLREIARAREVLVQTWQSQVATDNPAWESLNRYFLQFALISNN
ncbi:hypothetical protein KJ836_02870 [Patescibacteria group bacterium]|nr:hypothetical protein [Patescibacteria group bacterium]